MWWKGLNLEREIVGNQSVSLSPTLGRNEKVEHRIRTKTHKPIIMWLGLSLIGIFIIIFKLKHFFKLTLRKNSLTFHLFIFLTMQSLFN